MGLLLAGQGVNEVAKEYDLPTTTVSRWRAQALEAGPRADVGELLTAYLREVLVTLVAQVHVFRDPDWLRAQDASSVGVLHGILTDKAIRLLESLEASPMGEGSDG